MDGSPWFDYARDCPFGGSGWTRVLILAPGRLHDPLVADLKEMDVTADASCRPAYTAISYSWIRDDKSTLSMEKRIMLCNGKKLLLTEGSAEALFGVRDPIKNSWLWIDQICIDQRRGSSEIPEQLKLMRIIYECAVETICWLGLDHGDVVLTFPMFEGLAKDGCFKLEPGEREERALEVFFRRRYFIRLWVYQEIMVSKTVTMRSIRADGSPLGLSYDIFGKALDVLMENYRYLFKGKNRTFNAMSIQYSSYQDTLVRHSEKYSADFMDIAKATSALRCTVPEDKILALRGLIREPDQPEPRYGPIKDGGVGLFEEYTRWHIRQTKTLWILALRNQKEQNNIYAGGNWPSWVPDFHRSPALNPLYWFYSTDLAGPRHRLAETAERGVLEVEGMFIDSVSEVTKMTPDGLCRSYYSPPVDVLNWDWGMLDRFISLQTGDADEVGSLLLTAGLCDLDNQPPGIKRAEIAAETVTKILAIHVCQYRAFRELSEGKLEGNEDRKQVLETVSLADVYKRMAVSMVKRLLFCTRNSYISLGPRWTLPGDKVFALRGTDLQYVLRPHICGRGFQLVGSCSLYGFRDGVGKVPGFEDVEERWQVLELR